MHVVLHAAKETARAIWHEAATTEDETRQQKLRAHAKLSESHSRLSALLECAKSEPALIAMADQFDADPLLLNVVNGTLDLRTGELHPHRPTDLLSKIAPIAYDPTARSEVWERFLGVITCGDTALQDYLQRAAGYSLTGSTREECCFLRLGGGRNGKTKFLEALKYVLGDYALTMRPESLAAREGSGGVPTDLAELDGVRFVVRKPSRPIA
jgi:putative DNA primase/helicase